MSNWRKSCDNRGTCGKGRSSATMRALMAGRFEEGERLAQQALAIGQRIQSQTAANFFGVQLFWRHREHRAPPGTGGSRPDLGGAISGRACLAMRSGQPLQ